MISELANGLIPMELVTNLGETEHLTCSVRYPPELGNGSPEMEGQGDAWTEHMVKWQRKLIEVIFRNYVQYKILIYFLLSYFI